MIAGRHQRDAALGRALAFFFVAGVSGLVQAQVTVGASTTPLGVFGNGNSPDTGVGAKISADGRFVVFPSRATNLTGLETGGFSQIYRKNLVTGAVDLISVAPNGRGGSGNSYNPSVSSDGRFVAFTSFAEDLLASSKIPIPPEEGGGGDNNGLKDVFLRDTLLGTTVLISVNSAGQQTNGESDSSAISADGRIVAFRSMASNLWPTDENGFSDVFVRDVFLQTTSIASVASSGAIGNGRSGFWQIGITPDGRYIGFTSSASNLVSGDTNATDDVFLRDLATSTTERVSLGIGTGQGNGYSFTCAMSANARYVVFSSTSTNLVKKDFNGYRDVFLRDRVAKTTVLVSLDSRGKQANGSSGGTNDGWGVSAISEDGRFVAFQSDASNLISNPDRNFSYDIFMRDMMQGTTWMVSVSPAGTPGNGESWSPRMSADGSYVVFASSSSTLVAGDTNELIDVFVRGPAR